MAREKKGQPALDPFVWWGVGERMKLKQMGLERNAEGKIVKRSAK